LPVEAQTGVMSASHPLNRRSTLAHVAEFLPHHGRFGPWCLLQLFPSEAKYSVRTWMIRAWKHLVEQIIDAYVNLMKHGLTCIHSSIETSEIVRRCKKIPTDSDAICARIAEMKQLLHLYKHCLALASAGEQRTCVTQIRTSVSCFHLLWSPVHTTVKVEELFLRLALRDDDDDDEKMYTMKNAGYS